EQAGHSIATLAKHYAGVIRELEDAPRVPAAQAIRNAREHVCQWPSVSPQVRPSVLPTGGHLFSLLVAMVLPTTM
ncbi:MAG: hypothetical protein ABSG43_31455, partial [Solirubrobacteraceae bacterium]